MLNDIQDFFEGFDSQDLIPLSLVLVVFIFIGYMVYILIDGAVGVDIQEIGVVVGTQYEEGEWTYIPVSNGKTTTMQPQYDDPDYMVAVRCEDGQVRMDEVSLDVFYDYGKGDSVIYLRRVGGFSQKTRWIDIQEQP